MTYNHGKTAPLSNPAKRPRRVQMTRQASPVLSLTPAGHGRLRELLAAGDYKGANALINRPTRGLAELVASVHGPTQALEVLRRRVHSLKEN